MFTLPSRGNVVRIASPTGDPQVSNRSHTTTRESSPLYSAGCKGLRQATWQGLKGLDAVEQSESRFFARFLRNGYSGVSFSPYGRLACVD